MSTAEHQCIGACPKVAMSVVRAIGSSLRSACGSQRAGEGMCPGNGVRCTVGTSAAHSQTWRSCATHRVPSAGTSPPVPRDTEGSGTAEVTCEAGAVGMRGWGSGGSGPLQH